MFSLSHPVFQKGTNMPKLRNVIMINASPESVWAVLGDLAAVDTWISGIGQVQVDGYTRICTFANGAVQREEISNYSAEQHAYDYTIEGSPLPLKLNRGRFTVEVDGERSRVVWDAELEVLDVSQEADVIQMVDGASKQTLASLRQRIEEVFLS